MINKGTDKQYAAVFLLHNTTHHYQALSEKYLTEKMSICIIYI